MSKKIPTVSSRVTTSFKGRSVMFAFLECVVDVQPVTWKNDGQVKKSVESHVSSHIDWGEPTVSFYAQ